MPTIPLRPQSDRLWHQAEIATVVTDLATDLDQGLSLAAVEQRQQQYGANELPSQSGPSVFVRFLQEFNQPLIYILLVAGVIVLLLRDWVDAGVIFAVTLINAVIGFVQEFKAENAIAALAQAVMTEATVLRAGEKRRLNSRELVPGDLVLLSSGDKVPADLRLVTVRDLQVSEAALTGESGSVPKVVQPLPGHTELADRHNMVYAGSLVTCGQARGLVVAIGAQTETGRISQLMAHSPGLATPLTRKIEQFSQVLLYIILGFAALTLAVVLGLGGNWADGFKAAVALAVSAIPEGLPAVVTVTLAIGVGRMAQRHAIIRKLPAVETLGSTTVICSDKTGTLTENQMTVQQIYAGEQLYRVTGVGYDAADGAIWAGDRRLSPALLEATHPALAACLHCGVLCNDASLQVEAGTVTVAGDPTEGALLVAAQKAGWTDPARLATYPRLDTLPFASQFQYMATLHQGPEGVAGDHAHWLYVKGAAEAIVSRCTVYLNAQGQVSAWQPSDHEQLETIIHTLAHQGLRVLALAQRACPPAMTTLGHEDIHRDLVFLGLQGMLDPPRPEAIAAVQACQRAGIQVKMITGDHALTAQAIAQQMNLSLTTPVQVFRGQDLAMMTATAFRQAAATGTVFARVTPEQKLHLVEALQAQGEIVAMTGDGVNDAPALKQADIGVAMGLSGTEVAKEAADMILTDDNFAAIAAAVEEGRTVYANLLKTIGFILPVNGGEGLTILVGILAGSVLPILPVQILWVNMVSSVALSATLAFEPKSRDTMLRSPRPPQQPLLSGQLLGRVLLISLVNVLAVFGVFLSVQQHVASLEVARTMAVQTLVAAETFYLLSISQLVPSLWGWCRDRTTPIAYVPAIGIASVILLQLLFSQVPWVNPLLNTQPLTVSQFGLCLGAGLPIVGPALCLNRFAPLR